MKKLISQNVSNIDLLEAQSDVKKLNSNRQV